MHKGRRCPRFKSTWLTITSHVDTFAPERLNMGLYLFNGGATITIIPGEYSPVGMVDEDDLTVVWNGSSEFVVPGDTSWLMTLSFDPDRGGNNLDLSCYNAAIGEFQVHVETSPTWEAWNDVAAASINSWTAGGTTHTDGGTLTSRAKSWY